MSECASNGTIRASPVKDGVRTFTNMLAAVVIKLICSNPLGGIGLSLKNVWWRVRYKASSSCDGVKNPSESSVYASTSPVAAFLCVTYQCVTFLSLAVTYFRVFTFPDLSNHFHHLANKKSLASSLSLVHIMAAALTRFQVDVLRDVASFTHRGFALNGCLQKVIRYLVRHVSNLMSVTHRFLRSMAALDSCLRRVLCRRSFVILLLCANLGLVAEGRLGSKRDLTKKEVQIVLIAPADPKLLKDEGLEPLPAISPAVQLAVKNISDPQTGLLPGWNISVIEKDSQCSSAWGPIAAFEYHQTAGKISL